MGWQDLTLGVVLALVLAGCSGSSGETTTDTTSAEGVGQATGGAGGTGANGDALKAVLERHTDNGPAPLNVNFTVSASTKDGAVTDGTWTISIRQVANATGKPVTSKAVSGPTGTSMPKSFTLAFTTSGVFDVTATVKKTGFSPANATVKVTVSQGAAPPPKPILFTDDAEGDTSKWTITSEVLLTDPSFLAFPPTGSGQAYPDGTKWSTDGTNFRGGAKAYWSHYPDNYRTVMTLANPVTVPVQGASFSFYVKGGAEANGIDGLTVLVGPAGGELVELAHVDDLAKDWTHVSVPVPAGSQVVQLRFDADASCSDMTSPPAACGAGYNGHGFWIDDLLIQ